MWLVAEGSGDAFYKKVRKAGPGREKLNCSVVTTEASADPVGSSGAVMATQR